MSYLKKDNIDKCFSLLREYIESTPSGKNKGGAVLALDQLHNITAGSAGGPANSSCNDRPRANGSPLD
jgi:hypothetical protein